MTGQIVHSVLDFTYDADVVGSVLSGQVFQLLGLPNDALLLRVGHIKPVDPRPADMDELENRFNQCGECGGWFLSEGQRDRCGRRHEMSPGEQVLERRQQVMLRNKARGIVPEGATIGSPS